MNLAYNIESVDDDIRPASAVVEDFEPYVNWMDECRGSREYIKVIDGISTTQTHFTTDQDGIRSPLIVA